MTTAAAGYFVRQGALVKNRILAVLIGLGLVLGTVSVFAQEKQEPTKTEKKKKGKKKTPKKGGEEPKKQ